MTHLLLTALIYVGRARFLAAVVPQEPLQELVAQVNRDIDDESPWNLASVQRTAVETGPAGVPVLSQLLASGRPSRRYRAAYALAFTAQPESSDLLLREFTRSKDQRIRSLACFAVAGRGTAADIRFLVGALNGEHYGDDWFSIQVAALSLGVIRARSALDALEVTARKQPGSIASGAAAEAISWIRNGPFEVQSRLDSPDLSPVLAVMSHGVPRVSESSVFCETGAGRIWTRQGRAWTVERRSARKSERPSISFDAFLSSDNRRAVVTVGLSFGPLNGVGYDYLLSHEDKQWKVIGILPTWIS